MFWLYAVIALAVVAGGVTVVESYNHAQRSAATASLRADLAEQTARQAKRSAADLQELVDYGDDLAKKQAGDLRARDAALLSMEEKIRAAAKANPKNFACEDAGVPSAIRELRRATFGAEPAGGVLHPTGRAEGNPGPAASGRDVRPSPQGSGPGPDATPRVQPGQEPSAPDAGKAKPATQGLRDRIKALMGR